VHTYLVCTKSLV